MTSRGVSLPVIARGRTSRAPSKRRRTALGFWVPAWLMRLLGGRQSCPVAVPSSSVACRRAGNSAFHGSMTTPASVRGLSVDAPVATGLSALLTQPPGSRPATFEQLAALPDDNVDVALGAALLARDAYANLDATRVLARFDEL